MLLTMAAMRNSCISSTCPHNMVNFGTPMAETYWRVWGTPANFNLFHVGFVTAPMSLSGGQPDFAECLAVSWAGTQGIRFRELLPANGFLSAAKFTLRLSVAFSNIASVTARHPPFPQIDIIGAMVIVWSLRGKIIRSVLCNIVCNNCAQCNAHTYEQT